MEIPVIAEESEKKGIDIVGTGDILNPKWMNHVKEQTEENGKGLRTNGDTDFVLTTEVEDKNRVHHVIIFPDFGSVEKAYNQFKEYSKDIRREGRPRLSIDGEKIAEIALENDALIGPAHAFTPYTGMYSKHDSLKECYGSYHEEIKFLELGLSADSEMASRISHLENVSFLSNSDAHSPWPYRIGREFNRFEMEENSFDELKKSIIEGPDENIGLDPREGKYHLTACNSCHKKYSMEEAESRSWKCECGSTIKKGVKDRVTELADKKPDENQNYHYLPPLSRIIQKIVGHSSPNTKTVQKKWDKLYQAFGTEIEIILEVPIQKIKDEDREIGLAIEKFRKEKYGFEEGGGGKYGEIIV